MREPVVRSWGPLVTTSNHRFYYFECTCKNLIAGCLQLLDMHYLTGSEMISYLSGEGNANFSEGFLSRTLAFVFGVIGATYADLREVMQSFLCVLIGIHGQGFMTTIHV